MRPVEETRGPLSSTNRIIYSWGANKLQVGPHHRRYGAMTVSSSVFVVPNIGTLEVSKVSLMADKETRGHQDHLIKFAIGTIIKYHLVE